MFAVAIASWHIAYEPLSGEAAIEVYSDSQLEMCHQSSLGQARASELPGPRPVPNLANHRIWPRRRSGMTRKEPRSSLQLSSDNSRSFKGALPNSVGVQVSDGLPWQSGLLDWCLQ